MEVASLILSVVALIIGLMIAGFGIWFQWKLSEGSSRQLTEAQAILSKLEGVSLQLRETQQGQFGMMLEAVLHVPQLQQGEPQLPTANQPALPSPESAELQQTKMWLYYERTYRLIYGSQIAMLKEINEIGLSSIEAVKAKFYEMHLASAKQYSLTAQPDADQYMHFMTSWQLLEEEGPNYRITQYGIGFIVYCTQMGLFTNTVL